MLVAERYDRIVELVNSRGSIRVSELSELCGVTEETIRRDLDKLEATGKLRRSHGGAVSVKDEAKDAHAEIPFFEREVTQAAEKERIAREAVKRIEPRDRILLDASTTAWYMARIMPDIPLTVLTNSVMVVTALSNKERIEVIATGGMLSPRSLSFVGPLAEKALEAYHVEKLFLSCKGVHPERGISESSELQARLKERMIQIADQTVLLADSSKFGVQGFARVAGLEEVDAVITDSHVTVEGADWFSTRGVSVLRV